MVSPAYYYKVVCFYGCMLRPVSSAFWHSCYVLSVDSCGVACGVWPDGVLCIQGPAANRELLARERITLVRVACAGVVCNLA
jgi:hypothetical protein